MTAPVLIVRELQVSYRIGQGRSQALLQAVAGVSFTVGSGETLGIVGESGSGKSSIARALLRLVPATGEAWFASEDLLRLKGGALHAQRRHLQMIFQDPFASLDPRMSVAAIIAEPLRAFEPQLPAEVQRQRVLEALQAVGLSSDYLQRLPHECSGGQAQRVAIARALIARPQLVFCDEPLSALDVSIKSQIGNLLKDLQERMQLSLVFISHDLAAVRFACDRVLVLYLGRVMEIGERDRLFTKPQHPYTRALLQSAPIPDPRRRVARRPPLQGEIPSPLSPPSGCVFRSRCVYAVERCARERPELRVIAGSWVACHRAEELANADAVGADAVPA